MPVARFTDGKSVLYMVRGGQANECEYDMKGSKQASKLERDGDRIGSSRSSMVPVSVLVLAR